MAIILDRIKPTLNFYRLFGLGFMLDDSMTALTIDALLVCFHLSFCIYGYDHATLLIQELMPVLWDITTVTSVIKLYVYLMAPPTMIVMWQCNRRAITDLFYKLDTIVPSVESVPLVSYLWYSATWLSLCILVELLIYTTLHIDTNFVYLTMFGYITVVLYVTWTMLPPLMYTFLIKLISRGVKDINDRITSIGTWRTYRRQWKELRYIAVHSVEKEFGVIIVVYVVHTIAEIVFFLFSMYFLGYKRLSTGIVYWTGAFLVILFRSSWLFQIVQVSQNCKLEVNLLHYIKRIYIYK